MEGINLQHHFSLNSANEVKQLCSPLSSLGVTYFNYLKIYPDGSRELLTTNASWIEHFYSNALYASVGAIDIEHLLPKGYFLWSELNGDDPIYNEGREFFNIDNGVSFVNRRKDATYLYIFASNRENHQITNFYLRNIDLFKRFIQYFHNSGADLIAGAAKNKIILPDQQIICSDRIKIIEAADKLRKEFYHNTKVDKFFLLSESDQVYLTLKQAQCAAYLAAGATAKETGLALKLSPRTVETHIIAIKEKVKSLGIDLGRVNLIHFLRASGVHDVVFPEPVTKHGR